jgi:uncharacterized protein (DUF1499 family)
MKNCDFFWRWSQCPVRPASLLFLQIRSAARSGSWDLGKNRRRIEEIRKEFKK